MDSTKLVRESLAKPKQQRQPAEKPKTWYYITKRIEDPRSYYYNTNNLEEKFRTIAKNHYTKPAMADRTRIAPEADGLNITTL